MTFDRLAVDLDGAVATIVLNRPDKANAIDHAMWHESRAAMRWLDETPAARVGVIRGAAVERLRARLAGLARRPKPRRATKPTRGSKERRLSEKKRRGERKSDRRRLD